MSTALPMDELALVRIHDSVTPLASTPPTQTETTMPGAAVHPSAATGTKSIPVTAYNSPKDALLGCVKAGLAKSILLWWEMCLLGFNAGFFLAFGSIAGIVIASGFSVPTLVTDGSTGAVIQSIAANATIAKLVYGAIFPIGLIIIVLAGSELFTGNVMYLSLAYLSGKAEGRNVAKNLTLVWLANLGGSTFCAYFLAYLTELVHSEPQLHFLQSTAEKKLALGWGNVFLRGVGCNWLVCIALWQNLCSHDVVSKIIALWLPISTFVWIGWEHSIANMCVVPLALMEGLGSRHFGHFLAYNLIPVTLGNMVGGFLFAAGQLLIYGHYAKRQVETMTTKHVADSQTQGATGTTRTS